MSEQSLEGTWAALEVWPGGLNPEQRRVLLQVARAFGLAVLEAVVSKVTHDNSEGAFECDQCAWGVRDLRQRIERLGQP